MNQNYFWTSEWQQAEREADEDIKAGRVTRFSNVEEFIAYLDSNDAFPVPLATETTTTNS